MTPTTPDVELPPRRRDRLGRSATLTEAMAAIGDGDRVYVSPICAVPITLVDAMTEQRHRWNHLELITDYLVEPLRAFDHPGEPFHLTSLQPSTAVGAMRDAGALHTVPASYSQYFSLLRPGGRHPVDVALLQVSPPGPEGRFSLGVGVGTNVELLRTVPLVIAEVNRRDVARHPTILAGRIVLIVIRQARVTFGDGAVGLSTVKTPLGPKGEIGAEKNQACKSY